MQEIVMALLFVLNGEIIEFTYKANPAECLKSKRIAMREVNPNRVEFFCQRLKAKTEIYMGRKKILKIIDTMEKG